ncbi:DNA-directed RNA polymerase [Handroanthus impetiginosus]|uniref:DNA-directed RNA polymerase n=1 Tax=Handroanthus impetiginosus TaxID=429701 RepID=A0A2G9GX05_9LAMI|nr:DNA-directed RNA polymerase [Handroanthus impetiginosus]
MRGKLELHKRILYFDLVNVCFILSPLMKGQADTIGIAMRRALLGEKEGTCITRVKSENVPRGVKTG